MGEVVKVEEVKAVVETAEVETEDKKKTSWTSTTSSGQWNLNNI